MPTETTAIREALPAHVQPVILSGGAGKRLWPLSRKSLPKQFLSLHTPGISMFQETLLRAQALCPKAAPMVLAQEEHRFLVKDHAEAVGVALSHVLLEPAVRNTAPAIIAAALALVRQQPQALMLVLASDHVIENEPAFADAVATAVAMADQGHAVTFGITPTAAETGYGYIQRGEALAEGAYRVAKFVEKPNAETAQAYVNSGDYAWNSGMFVLPAALVVEEMLRLQPIMVEACRRAVSRGREDGLFLHLDKEGFGRAPATSIDYALMEHTAKAAVVPVSCGWSDVGSWDALHAIAQQDANGNSATGEAVALHSQDTQLHTSGPAIYALGVEGITVIASPDAVLITKRGHSQQVNQVVEVLQATKPELVCDHPRTHRPWGTYEIMHEAKGYKVKLIRVKPGAQLSLQLHEHRTENWSVVRGRARVTRDDVVRLIGEGECFHIPKGAVHRLENIGEDMLELIEVQTGHYLGEDDIHRLEDRYGRVATLAQPQLQPAEEAKVLPLVAAAEEA